MSKIALFVAAAALSMPAWAADPATAVADYQRMLNWQFSSSPIAIAAPVTITRDVATWTLDSGSIRLMEPTSTGAVTGFVFEGQGRFTMAVPDRFEAAQLRRYARRDMTSIDEPFTQLVFRTSDDTIAKLFPTAASSTYAEHVLATKRHEFSLVERFSDIDARIAAALVNRGELQMRVDANTHGLDWLTFDYDSHRDEEINLYRLHSGRTETWVSLDRAEQRQKDGRPGTPNLSPIVMTHVDIKADLTRYGRTGTVGRNHQRTIDGHYVVVADFTAIAGDLSALRVVLSPSARELKVSDESGAELPVMRDHIGKRSIKVDNRYHDNEPTVLLRTPMKRGEKRKLRFEYVLETANFAGGRSWYPSVPDTMEEKHTARLELTVAERNEVRSMGRLEKKSVADKKETSVWIVDKPTKMLTFSTATRFEEVVIEVKSIPPIHAFGPSYQLDNRDKTHNVGADVANSMQYFQNLLGEKIEAPQFYVTSIASNHGQAFDGFLHMGEFTFASDRSGASELFRAHEVAHEWWGHKVGAASYRDYWMSEALAEYSAMMFVQGFVKGGDQFLEEILDSYEGVVFGNFAGGFSKFARPGLLELNSQARGRLGPIAHGYRASTGEVPAGYVIQTYHKAPLVLHMLRTILWYRTGSDQLWQKTLRDFVKEYSGKSPTTDDFREVLEGNVGAGWGPFFDSWIYTAELPSYRWSYEIKPAEGGYTMTLNVKRSDVPPEFWTIIPVKIDYGDGKAGAFFIIDDKPEQTVTKLLQAKPKNVIFGPDHSLLAKIRKD